MLDKLMMVWIGRSWPDPCIWCYDVFTVVVNINSSSCSCVSFCPATGEAASHQSRSLRLLPTSGELVVITAPAPIPAHTHVYNCKRQTRPWTGRCATTKHPTISPKEQCNLILSPMAGATSRKTFLTKWMKSSLYLC